MFAVQDKYELTEEGKKSLDRFSQVFILVEELRKQNFNSTVLNKEERLEFAKLILFDLYAKEVCKLLNEIRRTINKEIS